MTIYLGLYFLAGLLVGLALQRSRLCFVSAARDFWLFGVTDMSRAILLVVLLTGAGGLLLGAGGAPGPSLGAALGGGVVFGVGMTLTGSCAATAFIRLGEGHASQLPILGGLFAGTWVYLWRPVSALLPSVTVPGSWLSLLPIGGALGALVWWERRQPVVGEEVLSTLGSRSRFRNPWPAELGAVLVALTLFAFFWFTGRTWAVTRVFLLAEWEPVLFAAGLLGGGGAGALIGGEWNWRSLGRWQDQGLRFAGGVLMGYGARIGMGCTIGALLSGMAAGSFQATVWLLGMVAGSWVGAQLLRLWLARSHS